MTTCRSFTRVLFVGALVVPLLFGLAPQVVAQEQAAADQAADAGPTEGELDEMEDTIRLSEEAARATSRRNPAILDTLAAGYAAAGRFGEAVATAQESVELYLERGDRGQAATVQGRMALYRQRSRYVDPRL